MERRPLVGVGVIVMRAGQVLLGKRRNTHGEGCWAFAGGHLHFGETLEECACREVREETGLEIRSPIRGPYTNDIFADADRHYITVFMLAVSERGEAALCEPDKCCGWEWFRWLNLPSPLFLPIRNLLATEFDPFVYR